MYKGVAAKNMRLDVSDVTSAIISNKKQVSSPDLCSTFLNQREIN